MQWNDSNLRILLFVCFDTQVPYAKQEFNVSSILLNYNLRAAQRARNAFLILYNYLANLVSSVWFIDC